MVYSRAIHKKSTALSMQRGNSKIFNGILYRGIKADHYRFSYAGIIF